jgi:hypothetical protein
MPTVTVPSVGITGQQIATALTKGLGPQYRVHPGKSVSWGFGRPHDADEDNIVVSKGSGRFSRTQVSIERRGDSSDIRIETPGPVQLRLLNAGMASQIRQALLGTPELRAR